MGSSEPLAFGGRGRDGWLLLAAFAILLLLYFSTVLSFYNVFSDEGSNQTHAPLLLLVSLYLLYRTWRQSGRRIDLRFNHLATALLIPLSLLWMLLGLVFVEAGQQAILILIAATVVLSMLGFRGGMKYLVPILLLLTVLPVWHLAIPYLQIAAAQASAYLLDLVGVTSIREGYLLIIPNGTFEVADACSGLKFQIVGITLALIHTQLIKVPPRVVLSYLLLASLLAFVSNMFRITIVVTIGYHYGMAHEYVQDHNFIGWSLFGLFFFLFLYLGERVLRRYEIEYRAEEAALNLNSGMSRRLMGVSMVVLAFAVGPILYGYFLHGDVSSSQDGISAMKQIPGWRVVSNRLSDWMPIWTKGDRSFEGSLASDGERIDLFATEFIRQRQGHEAVNVSHRVYHIDKWSRFSRSARVIKISDGVEVSVEETLLKSPNQRKRLVWLGYRTNNKIVASKVEAKLNNLIGVIAGEPDVTVFVLSKEIIRNEAHASEVLEQFLRAYLAQTGGVS